jgi:S1-C subfamily serine protease
MATKEATKPAASAGPPAALAPTTSGARWRGRVMPRTVLGMSALILSAAVGAAFSGTVLYAYYEYRLNLVDHRVAAFEARFKQNFDNAIGTIHAERDNAKADVQKELVPLQRIQAGGEVLQNLIKQVEPSVWFVHTVDEAGQPSVGSAFVVAADNNQSLMLTSFTTVRAATRKPGPDVLVRKGDQDIAATVYTWDEQRDLALLVLSKPNMAKLAFAPVNPPLKVGDRVFALSGLGGSGGAVSQGFVADVSGAGIQHDVPVGTSFQGGPLVNSKGEVLAVASRTYAPLNFTTDSVFFAAPIRDACNKVLRCPSGDVTGAGDRR